MFLTLLVPGLLMGGAAAIPPVPVYEVGVVFLSFTPAPSAAVQLTATEPGLVLLSE